MTLFCHSFWHLIWKYIWHIFSDILFRHSIWHSILAFCSGILCGILSGIYSDMFSGYLAFILIFYVASILTFFLASILAFFCLTFYFSKKATWYMPYLMTFFLAYVSVIFSDMAFDLVYLGRFFVVEVRRGRLCRACSWGPAEEGGWGGGPADIKSNNLHLTGGEQVKVMKTFFDGDRPFLDLFCFSFSRELVSVPPAWFPDVCSFEPSNMNLLVISILSYRTNFPSNYF